MRLLKSAILFFTIPFVLCFVFQFIVNSRYTFPDPTPFKGEKLYNPYQVIDSTMWKRANFHLHKSMLFGLTAGSKITDQIADKYYKYYDYDIIGSSDYMKINTYESDSKQYIPVYEHGYSYFKTHQLVLNAGKVCLYDFLYRQTTDNKQFIIDKLKRDPDVLISLVHPAVRKAFQISDFRHLCNYDLFEIANNSACYSRYYDEALSTGHAVFLLANDDAHSFSKIGDAAHSFNLINADTAKNSILQAMKTGRSYGVRLNTNLYKNEYEKKLAINNIPILTEFNIKNGTIFMSINRIADTIKFIGQNGNLKKTCLNCSKGVYPFYATDTYIRIEIICRDGSKCFLNPVFRYDGKNLPAKHASVNVIKTRTIRIVFCLAMLMIILLGRKAVCEN